MDDIPISFTLIERYCLDDSARWWLEIEIPLEYDNPLKEMILHLGSGDLWGLYEGVSIPSLACNIEPQNLEKRARAIIELISDPGQNEKYIRKMAQELQIKCINAGKQNLATGIGEAMSLTTASEVKKINLEKREALKRRMTEIL